MMMSGDTATATMTNRMMSISLVVVFILVFVLKLFDEVVVPGEVLCPDD